MHKTLNLLFIIAIHSTSTHAFDKTCDSSISEIKNNLSKYGELLSNEDTTGAFLAAKEIKKEMRSLRANPSCLKSALKIYLSESLDLFINLRNYDQFYGSKKHLPFFDSTPKEIRKIIFETDILEPLDKATGDAGIFGLYECSFVKIYIDPELSPFNLLSAFLHELSHATRDRLGSINFGALGAWKASEIIFIDELISTLESSFYQILAIDVEHIPMGLEENYRSKIEMLRSKNEMLSGNYDHKLPLGDIDFFDRRGHLRQHFFNEKSHIFSYNTGFPFPDGIVIPFSGFFASLFSTQADPETKLHTQAILTTIAKAYGLSKKINIKSTSDSLVSALDPIHASQKEIENLLPSSIERESLKLFQISLSNKQPSQTCQYFLQALKSGELEGYIGLGVEGSRTGGEGSRTGVEGSRTGGEGSRTGVEGSRTGGEGSRTGAEGSRTGSRFTRPCVHPKTLNI